jgi:1-acyl-sn-glycerol-3-phosphate acyltransferase
MVSLNSLPLLKPTLQLAASIDRPPSTHSEAFSKIPPALPPTPVALTPGSQIAGWLSAIVYPIGRYGVLPFYFSKIEVIGQENLPTSGSVILAPTHRSRWDALLIPYVAGFDVTGRHLRFMVSNNEVKGLQGWFIRRLGGFAIDTQRPAIASLRHGVELLQQGEPIVIFPEGDIFRDPNVQPLKPGFARLALQALSHSSGEIWIVPIHLHYSQPMVPWRSRVKVQIGTPLQVSDYAIGSSKQNAKLLTTDLEKALQEMIG